jgi:hypothetical protein
MINDQAKLTPMNACQLYEIADQICDFINSYDINVAEARIIAALVPSLMNDQLTRYNAAKDRETENGDR